MSSSPAPLPPEMVVKNRFLGFLIWQSIPSTAIYFFFKTFLLSPLSATTTAINFTNLLLPSLFSVCTFLTFHISQLLFSTSLFIISSPQLIPPASPPRLALALLRLLFVSSESFSSADFRRHARVSLNFVVLVASAASAGFLSVASVCGGCDGILLIGRLGFRGFVFGWVYALVFIYKQRWVLEFPIIQRPPFFSFKMGVPSAIKRAIKLSSVAYLISALLLVFLPKEFKSQLTMRQFITEQIILYIGSFAVFLCWELSHHLHQVLHTKRFIFAPPKGSAAAETNPSDPLLAALEESTPNTVPQYLAYLDLCMVCENNVDTWRRAAFFEETGETYKRVVAVCLRPLEQLASNLGEGLEGCSAEKACQLSNQLQSPTESHLDAKYCEPLNNFQKLAWCARAISSLTTRSCKEDKFGVAQLSGSNATVISTLLSCLLAVEALLGKKTNLQPANQFMGPAGIKWAPLNTGRRDVVVAKKKSGLLHSKAYAMADVLRTSIYCIVSAFHNEMFISAQAGLLEKYWVSRGKPLFGSQELLQQKLHHFLDFRAS